MTNSKTTIVNIQILRFFAAFWVLIYHAKYFFNLTEDTLIPPQFFRFIQNAGFVGVDIFFVISGIIMALTTHRLDNTVRNSARFISVRFSRIYTGWWPLFVLYWLVASLTRQLEGKWFFASLLLLPATLPRYILGVLWTLSFELYFYCMVAMVILAPKRWRNWFLIATLIGIAGFTAWSAWRGYYTPHPPSDVWPLHSYILFPLIIEFIGGFLLYQWVLAYQPRRAAPWIIGAVVFFLVGAIYQMKIGIPQKASLEGFYGVHVRVLLVGGFALCLAASAMIAKPWQGRFGHALSQLGDASYAIYLSHFLILMLTFRLLRFISWPVHWYAPTFSVMVLSVLVFSVIYYKKIEQPFYRWVRQRIGRWFQAAS